MGEFCSFNRGFCSSLGGFCSPVKRLENPSLRGKNRCKFQVILLGVLHNNLIAVKIAVRPEVCSVLVYEKLCRTSYNI